MPAALPLRSDFEQLPKENPTFTYVMTVEPPTGDWQGERGRLTAEMVKKYVPDLDNPIDHLSGSGGMVKQLVDRKVNEGNIRTEEFTGY